MSITKVILVDDQRAFRTAVKMQLNAIGGNEVVAEAGSADELLYVLEKYTAQVIFMDIEMPGMSGIEATKLILNKHPEMVVIGWSMYDDTHYIRRLIEAGAQGYLLKLSDNYTLLEEIIRNPYECPFFSKELIETDVYMTII